MVIALIWAWATTAALWIDSEGILGIRFLLDPYVNIVFPDPRCIAPVPRRTDATNYKSAPFARERGVLFIDGIDEQVFLLPDTLDAR